MAANRLSDNDWSVAKAARFIVREPTPASEFVHSSILSYRFLVSPVPGSSSCRARYKGLVFIIQSTSKIFKESTYAMDYLQPRMILAAHFPCSAEKSWLQRQKVIIRTRGQWGSESRVTQCVSWEFVGGVFTALLLFLLFFLIFKLSWRASLAIAGMSYQWRSTVI